ncbi:ATPase, T2SS/T4P/T4SS family [Achromobacter aloeverae]
MDSLMSVDVDLPELDLPTSPADQQPREILSALEGDPLFAPPAVREKAALDNQGVLFLAEGAEIDLHVQSYIANVRRDSRSGIFKETRHVPFTEIQRIYAEAAERRQLSAAEVVRDTIEQGTVVAVVTEAARLRASDVFIESGRLRTEVQYRIHGDVEKRFGTTKTRGVRLVRTVYDSMCDSVDPYYNPGRDQSGRMKLQYLHGLGLHQIRVSTGPTDEDRPFMALRLHYDLGEPQSLVALGYTEEHEATVDEAAQNSSGIILFSGPTGSGKSTSLANYVGRRQKMDGERRKVISLEDPPEIPIFGTVQKAVLRRGADREAEGRGWIEGFETLMRWNPDWIIAGELRLRETMDAALKASMTNHLTWGMLHASSATIIPERLREEGIQLSYLADSEIFRVFANQSLAPTLCPHCSTTYAESASQLSASLRARVEQFCTPDTVRVRGPGCPHCHRGSNGRTICAEVMMTSPQSMNVYRHNGELALRRYWVYEMGGQTKTHHLIAKINLGLIDPRDAERIVSPINSDSRLQENA